MACKKESDNPNSGACNGKNLCFKKDGTLISQDAKWIMIGTNRMRILWEETSAGSYKNIEIDMYGTAAGTYAVKANPSAAGEAGFQYYTNPGTNIAGESGEIKLTSMANDKLTGTFTVTAKDGAGNTVAITEGNFSAVPK